MNDLGMWLALASMVLAVAAVVMWVRGGRWGR